VCRVIFADDALVVADKAAGYPVTPGGAFHQRSVIKSLQAQGFSPLYPISLLDPEASGLVVLSRSAAAAKALRWNWRSGLCERTYIGVVQGDVAGARGKIQLAIGAVQHGRGVRHQVLSVPEGGRTALTEWKLLARGRGLSRLQLTVKAGRCHQLRIHLAAMGYALVGDRQHRPPTTEVPIEALVDLPRKHEERSTLPPGQIALHCARIRMPHPLTGKSMDWSAAVPRALVSLMPGAWVLEG
jgi:23S rRNA-/tRNA-specific pseudouridylate synthase